MLQVSAFQSFSRGAERLAMHLLFEYAAVNTNMYRERTYIEKCDVEARISLYDIWYLALEHKRTHAHLHEYSYAFVQIMFADELCLMPEHSCTVRDSGGFIKIKMHIYAPWACVRCGRASVRVMPNTCAHTLCTQTHLDMSGAAHMCEAVRAECSAAWLREQQERVRGVWCICVWTMRARGLATRTATGVICLLPKI